MIYIAAWSVCLLAPVFATLMLSNSDKFILLSGALFSVSVFVFVSL